MEHDDLTSVSCIAKLTNLTSTRYCLPCLLGRDRNNLTFQKVPQPLRQSTEQTLVSRIVGLACFYIFK